MLEIVGFVAIFIGGLYALFVAIAITYVNLGFCGTFPKIAVFIFAFGCGLIYWALKLSPFSIVVK